MPELKTCPFCGQIPTIEESARFPRYGKDEGERIKGYTVVCKNINCILLNADNWYRRSGKEACEAWNHRAEPENRLLTVNEATGSEDPVWLETRKRKTLMITDVCIATDYHYAEVYTIGRGIPYLILLDSYGKLWRCWPRKPTPEQMAAAEWEE